MDGLGDLKASKDLTNTKLAKNQLVRVSPVYGVSGWPGPGPELWSLTGQVLHEQIETLRRTVDRQSDMLAALMQALEVKATERERSRSSSGKRKSIDKDRDQFTVGDSDDEADPPDGR